MMPQRCKGTEQGVKFRELQKGNSVTIVVDEKATILINQLIVSILNYIKTSVIISLPLH